MRHHVLNTFAYILNERKTKARYRDGARLKEGKKKNRKEKKNTSFALFTHTRRNGYFSRVAYSSSIRYTSTKSVSLISLSFTYNIYLCTTSV